LRGSSSQRRFEARTAGITVSIRSAKAQSVATKTAVSTKKRRRLFRQSRVIAAEMTPFGMINLKLRPEDRDCYLYMFEVGLDPNGSPAFTSCPQVAMGQHNSSFTGTRSMPHCSK
jgi:hypothetical protein